MNDISISGVLNVGPYKGYSGRAEYDPEANEFHGEVTDTKDVITFVASEPVSLIAEFCASVDDYLEFCKERGEDPEKPFSGKFLVRTPPSLHRLLVNKATHDEKSLNQLVVDMLTTAVSDTSFTMIPHLENEFTLAMGTLIDATEMVSTTQAPTATPSTSRIDRYYYNASNPEWSGIVELIK